MKRRAILLTWLLMVALVLGGCQKPTPNVDTAGMESVEAADADFSVEDGEMFSERDREIGYDETHAVSVLFAEEGVTASSDAVHVSERRVVLSEEGTYVFSGSWANGQIVVDASESAKLHLVFDGVTVHCEDSAPLYIPSADKVFVTLADGTENTLSCGETLEMLDGNNVDGAIFSKQDLTVNGTGRLSVVSPSGHGIVCKDDLCLAGGNYTVNAASHGLDANDSVRLSDVCMTIRAGKDGIHAENTEDSTLGFVYAIRAELTLTAEGDGISASAHVQIEDGTYAITSGGGHENASRKGSASYGAFPGRPGMSATQNDANDTDSPSGKGIKAGGGLLMNGGVFSLDCADDALHSNANLFINSGTYTIATGDDGAHADETLQITAGKLEITESYEGLEGLNILIQGGEISLVATDDGLNAAGGMDQSGMGGMRGDDGFGGRGGRGGMGEMNGGMPSVGNGSITVSGGTLFIRASGDGIDANGTLTVTGGNITVCGPTIGDTATLDYDVSATITGGTFIGTGASGMAQTFSHSEQGVIAVSMNTQTAGTQVTVCDGNGNELLSYAPPLSFAVLIVSTPELEKGESYTVTIGSQSKAIQAN